MSIDESRPDFIEAQELLSNRWPVEVLVALDTCIRELARDEIAKLSPAPVGREAEPTMQYYYRVSGCPASNPTQSECICWHDQGTGPVPDAVASAPRDTHVWREKPAPTPPAKHTISERAAPGYGACSTATPASAAEKAPAPTPPAKDTEGGLAARLRRRADHALKEHTFVRYNYAVTDANLDREAADRIADLEARLAEATNELHCCDDLPLDGGLVAGIAALRTALADARKRIEALEAGVHELDAWSKAYPLSVFPEPDFAKARALLEAGGMTLDAVSASNMRHVVKRVGEIVSALLSETQASEGKTDG